jgi:2-polyprenyl-6-methoxyphenol hydroxylase-like FAD-dependent oxidoreductase
MASTDAASDVDVLIVGAGPTGLALAAELRSFGVSFRIIDRAPDAVHESRALAIQARTLEVLARQGSASQLVEAGDRATVLQLHANRSTTSIPLFDAGIGETAFPFLLFLSQAETERILADDLAEHGTTIERDSALLTLDQDPGGVVCVIGSAKGSTSTIRARYVVGCDGAHSAVRQGSGIGFVGRAFPQTFALADLEADGLEPGRVHAFLGASGMLFFFPLRSPASWRMLVLLSPGERPGQPTLDELQALVAEYTAQPLTLHDPVWLTHFSVQSRRAARFSTGRVFLAGDAAHIHSPAGAQGMNTGIQDAVNLGWKLALACRGSAGERLLQSYQAERMPVAASVLRLTDRLFRLAMNANPAARFLRPRVAGTILPLVVRIPYLRRVGFRVISQLSVGYRHSPLSVNGRPLPGGLRAGDRLPYSPITVEDVPTTLHAALSATRFTILLCGPVARWASATTRNAIGTETIDLRWPGLAHRVNLTTSRGDGPGWVASRASLRRLGLGATDMAIILVRPDGYIGYAAGGTALEGVARYLDDILG